MTTDDNIFLAKTSKKYYCKYCDYTTSRKYNYDIHNDSVKHKKLKNNAFDNDNNAFLAKTSKTYNCENCYKIFNDRAGLWRHKKKCNIESQHKYISDKEDIITLLLKDNSDLKNILIEQQNLMMKVIENGSHNTTNNTTTHTNSHNKAFNLNFFLNETCKNAMNITDFVDSIKLQLSDLIDMGHTGYVEGISKIIVKNLNALDETERPIHCTDKKRETFYIKDEDKWEKEDDDRKKIKNTIKHVANKNIRLLSVFKENFPDYNDSDSIYSDQYSKIVIEAMGGTGNNDNEKEEKIIRNISRATTIVKGL